MHTEKNIIICKFNLKIKCQFGEKCKFKHLSIKVLNEILNEFEDIKQENVLLKKNLKEIRQKLNNSDKNFCDVTITKNNVNSIDKSLYNSFFKESKYSSDSKTKLIQKNKTKIMIKSEGITSNSENEYMDRMPTNNKSKLKINLLETDEKELNLVETHNKLK
jgi:hypothetical protein